MLYWVIILITKPKQIEFKIDKTDIYQQQQDSSSVYVKRKIKINNDIHNCDSTNANNVYDSDGILSVFVVFIIKFVYFAKFEGALSFYDYLSKSHYVDISY